MTETASTAFVRQWQPVRCIAGRAAVGVRPNYATAADFSQAQAAPRMGVSVSTVPQIEKGNLSTRDVLGRYIAALGGTLNLAADIGDAQLRAS